MLLKWAAADFKTVRLYHRTPGPLVNVRLVAMTSVASGISNQGCQCLEIINGKALTRRIDQAVVFQPVKRSGDALAGSIRAAGKIRVGRWGRNLHPVVFSGIGSGQAEQFGMNPIAGIQGAELKYFLIGQAQTVGKFDHH